MDVEVKARVEPEEVVRLGRSVNRTWVDPARVKRMLAGSDYYLTCRLQGRLIGFASVASDGAFFAYAQHVWVAPEHQGRGVGRALMEHILADLEARGFLGLGLIADQEAVGFYQKLAFVPAEEEGYHGLIRKLGGETRKPVSEGT